MENKTPKITEITADTVLEEIRRKAPFYVPEWTPGIEGDFGSALSRIFAEMVENIASNLNDVPRKHLLSFLDLLNFSLLPARPARTVLCFVPSLGAQENIIVPIRTRITAEGPQGEEIFFETEKTIASTPSKLCFVCSSDQQRDAIFDHSSTIEGRETSILFSGENLQEHIFYIGDEELFKIVKGKINLNLEAVGSIPARVLAEKNLFIWEYAAPETEEGLEITEWIPFLSAEYSDGKLSILKQEEIVGKGKVNGLESRWIRCLINCAKISDLEHFMLGSVKVGTSAKEINPDLLFYNDIPLENGEEGIQPFGSKPMLYDTFYIACSEVFSRHGCEIQLDFDLIPGRTDSFSEKPVISFEYWSGNSWRNLKKFMNFSLNLEKSGEEKVGSKEEFLDLELENFLENNIQKQEDENVSQINVSVKIREMPFMTLGNVNGEENYWIRARLIGGNYGKEYVISKKNIMEPGKFYPPKIKNLILGYSDEEGSEPEYIISMNNRNFTNKKQELKMAGRFKPFEKISESLPTVYFGFTSKIVKGPISLFARLEETFVDFGLPVKFKWQYLSYVGNGNSGEKTGEWKELQFFDETRGLAKRGILEFFVPGEMKPIELYGSRTPLYWIRLLFTEGARASIITGLYPNCVYALQGRTIEDEILGSSSNEIGQVFELMNNPVVDAEVWINEVSWLTEGEKYSLLKNSAQAVKATKSHDEKFSEFWVRWREVENFSDSERTSRHYTLDRNSGKIRFGNGTRGMSPPLGMNNIKASYMTGGGEVGNLEPLSITKLFSSLEYIDMVYNPVISEGGSKAESLEKLVERATSKFKHRDRAVNREDIIHLTKESSEKVAKVNVLSGLDEVGKNIPGLMTVVILPALQEPKPVPTDELIQIVETYLKKRMPNVGKLKVTAPLYFQVNVSISVIAESLEVLNEVENNVKIRIEEYLHPLTGGKNGAGWDFGQVPSAADFYFLLSNLKGISYVKEIEISSNSGNGTPDKSSEPDGTNNVPESALPCNGKHEIKVLWTAQREE
jgi:hypothetical protein